MIKNIAGTGIWKDHSVKIRPHSGATSIGMRHYIKPELCDQPDVIILHCGTNDISNEIHSLKKLNKLLKEIEGYDTQKSLKLSYLVQSKDMIKTLMKILKALMKKFKLCAHPKVCLLLTIAILIIHVWTGVSCTWIEEVCLSCQMTLRNL